MWQRQNIFLKHTFISYFTAFCKLSQARKVCFILFSLIYISTGSGLNRTGKDILQSRDKGLCFFCSGRVCCKSRMKTAYEIDLALPKSGDSEFWQVRAEANLCVFTIGLERQRSQGHRTDFGKCAIFLQLVSTSSSTQLLTGAAKKCFIFRLLPLASTPFCRHAKDVRPKTQKTECGCD